MEKIKVLLSDPQIVFREGMHFILSGEDDFEVIGEAAGNDEALALIEDNSPNVAILNMIDGKLAGPEVTRRIKRNLPSVSVILVTDNDDSEILFLAMKTGASACLNKDADPKCLVSIIREIARGSQPIVEALLTAGLASRVLSEFEELATLSEQPDNILARLAPKETEILGSIAAANGIEQVTAKLNINEKTVRHHLRMILNKMVANEQTRALIEAVQRSLPLIISGTFLAGKPATDYITKSEFNQFKESLKARFKSFTGELT